MTSCVIGHNHFIVFGVPHHAGPHDVVIVLVAAEFVATQSVAARAAVRGLDDSPDRRRQRSTRRRAAAATASRWSATRVWWGRTWSTAT
jgi:hypothetical protein